MTINSPPGRRPRLTPAIADVRRAVREMLHSLYPDAPDQGQSPLALVALSGGADSLALAAATAFEAPRAGIRAGAIIVDHNLQSGSAAVAAHAAEQARGQGLDPVIVRPVNVGEGSSDSDGPEAMARTARYRAFREVMDDTGAAHIFIAHTLDDQAETVLLGLARGSGATSLQGMAAVSGDYVRPLLSIRRRMTRQFCADSRLVPWDDPHNVDPTFARVRVRERVLPTLETELGPGIADALARTAQQLREDAEALDDMVVETIEDICEPAEAGIAVSAAALAVNPPALRNRIIRSVVHSEFGVSLERVHVLETARLVTDWHGQKPLNLPGVRVTRRDGLLVFEACKRP